MVMVRFYALGTRDGCTLGRYYMLDFFGYRGNDESGL